MLRHGQRKYKVAHDLLTYTLFDVSAYGTN